MTTEEAITQVARPEIIRALRLAHDEIVTLRRRVAELEPKAHAYDTISRIAALTEPDRPIGFAEDPAWRIKTLVDRLVAEREAERKEAEGAQDTGGSGKGDSEK